MFGRFISRTFLGILGWKIKNAVPMEELRRCVLLAAPHTTNWDQPIAVAAMSVLGVHTRYTIKKEWLGFPLGWFIRMTGGIGIDRTPKKAGDPRPSTVEAIVQLFKENDELALMIPPEGSRSLRKEWKTGFYYIALQANVPMALGYLDYAKKEAGIGKIVYPTGDIEKDMREIMDFYQHITGKFPEKFSLDVRYLPHNDTPTPPNADK